MAVSISPIPEIMSPTEKEGGERILYATSMGMRAEDLLAEASRPMSFTE